MQRVRLAVGLDGARRRDQRLADHLSAEDALPADLRAAPRKRLCSSGSRSRMLEQLVDGGRHEASSPEGRRIRRGAEGRQSGERSQAQGVDDGGPRPGYPTS